jgi:hypothetical protein
MGPAGDVSHPGLGDEYRPAYISTHGAPMRTRTSLLGLMLVALIATGCTESTPPPDTATTTKTAEVTTPEPTKKSGKAIPKKPKVIGKMTGPTQLQD